MPRCSKQCAKDGCCRDAVWLDNNAVMPPLPQVRRQVTDVLNKGDCCKALASARETICRILGTEGAVVFTSGGTENALLISAGTRYAQRSRMAGSVMDPLCMLMQPDIEILPIDSHGYLVAEQLRQLLLNNADIAAVSLTLVNGEYGVISPVEALAKLVKIVDPEVFVYVDAAQACTRMRLDQIPAEVDAVGISGAKIGALPGTGALWLRDPGRLDTLLPGGQDQFGIREGSLNEIGIAAMDVALKRSLNRIDQDFEQLSRLRRRLDEMILNVEGVSLNFDDKALVCNTSNYYVEDIDSRKLCLVLRKQGVRVSESVRGLGMTTMRTPLTESMDMEPFRNLRFSLSIHNTTKELEQAYFVFTKAVKEFRRHKLGS